tara:strand:+ start:42 stop:947 length:906 start_codon:yes stop_codon:yes gene_type:complete
MRVVYGHTDSIYVQMPMERAEETLALLNNHVRSMFPNLLELDEHPVTLEFEKYYETLGVGCTKNRNAGLISWKDGKWLDEHEFVMTGFSAKRVAVTTLAKTIQLEVLNRWVNRESEESITAYLKDEYNRVLNGNISTDEITNRSRFRPERFQYKCNDCNKEYSINDALERHKEFSTSFCGKCGSELNLKTMEGKQPTIGSGVEGVVWWNQTFQNPIEDSYFYVRVQDDPMRTKYINPITGVHKRPTYIAAPTKDAMPNHTPDYRHYSDSIIKKAEPIYNAMGWDLSLIRKDVNQTNLDEWW